jgi:DNA-directed RNA polymerase subunit RPC12/RpoP
MMVFSTRCAEKWQGLPIEPSHLVKEIEKYVKTDRVVAPASTAAAMQPAAATQAPALPRSGTAVKPVDPVAAKQLSKKLSHIYIPSAGASGTTVSIPDMPEEAMQPGGVGNQPASGMVKPQAPAVKRPAPKQNDEPEIKIFYHSEAAPIQPPEPAFTPSPPQQTFDNNRPGQRRAAPEPSTMTAQQAADAGLGNKATVTAPSQVPKSASPPTTGLQTQQIRNVQPGAEANHAAPQTQCQAQPAAKPAAAPRPASPPPSQAALQAQLSIKIACTGCGTIYTNIKPEHIGKYARCKKCGTRFLIG